MKGTKPKRSSLLRFGMRDLLWAMVIVSVALVAITEHNRFRAAQRKVEMLNVDIEILKGYQKILEDRLAILEEEPDVSDIFDAHLNPPASNQSEKEFQQELQKFLQKQGLGEFKVESERRLGDQP